MRVLLLLQIAAAAGSASAATHVRGARPEHAAKYEPVAGEFACFDGSKKIPFSAVNDDYCDCRDGTDEPGA